MQQQPGLIALSILAAINVQATTEEYSWEDGGTVLGAFQADHITHTQSAEQARTGNFSLRIADVDATDNSTPQSYIAWVNGITDGDTVNVSLWVYDDQDGRPAGRLWAHYTIGATDVTSFAGSASGNGSYTTGAGWQQVQHTWTFDSDGGNRDGIMLEFRLYDSADVTTGVLYLDDLGIESSAGSITLANGAVVEEEVTETPENGDGTVTTLVCGAEFTAINAIQGAVESTTMAEQVVEVEAIVTADFQDSLRGFYLQTATGEDDSDPSTSEAIFVYIGNERQDINVSDRVRISATVGEYKGSTQLSSVTRMIVCAEQAGIPATTAITLPFDSQPEHLEGMLVSFADLTVNEVVELGRYGTATLANGRRFIPTQIATPGKEAIAIKAANELNRIILDDGSNAENPEVVPYPPAKLSASNSLRIGDTLSLARGIMHYAFDNYRIHPTTDVTVKSTHPRMAAPELAAEGNLKIASFNVFNYFTTLGKRGADTEHELERQEAKIIAALRALDADVTGLVELENNGFGDGSAIARLTAALDVADPDYGWRYVVPKVDQMGSGAITVGIVYRSTVVTPVGAAAILDSSNSITNEAGEPLFLDTKNRPVLAQEFSLIDNNESFVIAVNHLKSKGSDCDDVGDPKIHDGQGNCNLTRTNAAQAVADWLNTDFADKAVMVIGDLNAYAKEDPLTVFADAGYTELFAHFKKTDAYSYVFSGESGQLDHALANATMLGAVIDVTAWHINTDEPVSLDYNVEYKSDAQIKSYYAADAYRSSDHDPVVIAVKLETADSGSDGHSGEHTDTP